MSGINYQQLRAQVTIEQVLHLISFHPSKRRGPVLRGPCPIHGSSSSRNRTCFSVNLERNIFRCFRCGAKGNQLDLWHLFCKRPFYEATLDLCQQLSIAPPWLTLSPPIHISRFRNSPPQSPPSATT